MTQAKAGLYCTFRLGEQLFGVNILDVKEVNAATGFTAIPHAPPEVCGYVNLRGQIHLVLDLRRLLDLGRAELALESRLVLFKPPVGEAFGVLVDRIGDIVRLDSEQIEGGQPDDTRPGGDFVIGMGKLESELVILLEPRRFLKAIERRLSV